MADNDTIAYHPVYNSEHTGVEDKTTVSRRMVEAVDGIPTKKEYLEKLNNGGFRPKEGDVWIVTFPKCGTTWLSEILLQLYTKGSKDELTRIKAERHKLGFGRTELFYAETVDERIEAMNTVEYPRLFITHVSEEQIPRKVFETGKVIVVLRNPKDTCVSYYHFHRMNKGLGLYNGPFSTFFECFASDSTFYGSWFSHTLNWWNRHKDDKNVLFLKYEDMKKNPKDNIRKIIKFIGMVADDKLVDAVENATHFDRMKEDTKHHFDNLPAFKQSVSHFMRKGEVGDWKTHFTVAQNELYDKIYAEKMKGSDLTFEFE